MLLRWPIVLLLVWVIVDCLFPVLFCVCFTLYSQSKAHTDYSPFGLMNKFKKQNKKKTFTIKLKGMFLKLMLHKCAW